MSRIICRILGHRWGDPDWWNAYVPCARCGHHQPMTIERLDPPWSTPQTEDQP